MIVLREYISAALTRLVSTHGKLSVREVEALLCAMLDAQAVHLTASPNASLDEAVQKPLGCEIRVRCDVVADPFPRTETAPGEPALGRAAAAEDPAGVPATARGGPSDSACLEESSSWAETARPGSESSEELMLERIVLALDAQERKREFVWMGYVVRELLPGLGFSERETQVLLQRLKDEGVITTVKRPNPKNPDFPATGVGLNREHPLVNRVLNRVKSAPRRFPLGRIRGELLSETIIRERR